MIASSPTKTLAKIPEPQKLLSAAEVNFAGVIAVWCFGATIKACGAHRCLGMHHVALNGSGAHNRDLDDEVAERGTA